MSLRAIFAKSRFSCLKTCKNNSKTLYFFTFCATTEPSLFATPHGIFGDFCIFRIRDFKKGQKPLEGWQKVRVPENRKSAKIVGEFEVLPRPAGCPAIFLLPQNPKKI